MRHIRITRAVSAGALVALATAACGTTVPQASQQMVGGAASLAPTASTNTGAEHVGGTGGPTDGINTHSPGTGTSTGGGGVVGATSTTGAAGTSGPGATIVPPNTSPITVGITYIDNATTSGQLGYADSSTVSKKTIVEALVRGLNATGGVGGRRIRAVIAGFDSSSSDWSSQAAAACQTFTQDNHVEVVLDLAFGTIGGFRDCLNRQGIPVLTSSSEGDRASSQANRLHANTMSMTTDRSYGAVIAQLNKVGVLTGKNQLGIILEGCPANEHAYEATIKPLIDELALKKPQVVRLACTSGFQDAAVAASVVSNAVLTFEQAGVDSVLSISDNEAVVVGFFAPAAEAQQYYPRYLLSSNAQAQSIRGSLRPASQKNMYGVGNVPYGDVDGSKPTAPDERCKELAKKGGVGVAAYQDWALLVFECGPFLLLDAALRSNDGQTARGAVMNAVNRLGTTFAAPGIVDGSTRYAAGKPDGPERVRIFRYVTNCSCLRYTGTAVTA